LFGLVVAGVLLMRRQLTPPDPNALKKFRVKRPRAVRANQFKAAAGSRGPGRVFHHEARCANSRKASSRLPRRLQKMLSGEVLTGRGKPRKSSARKEIERGFFRLRHAAFFIERGTRAHWSQPASHCRKSSARPAGRRGPSGSPHQAVKAGRRRLGSTGRGTSRNEN